MGLSIKPRVPTNSCVSSLWVSGIFHLRRACCVVGGLTLARYNRDCYQNYGPWSRKCCSHQKIRTKNTHTQEKGTIPKDEEVHLPYFLTLGCCVSGTCVFTRRLYPYPRVFYCRHEQTAKDMLSRLEQTSAGGDTNPFGLDVRGIVRLFGALQSNGFASGIYLHPAMTNHSCRCGTPRQRPY